MRPWRAAAVLAWVLFAGSSAAAQAPDVTPPADAELTAEATADLDEYALPVASFAAEVPTVTLRGAVTRRAWRMPVGERTVVSVMASYRKALARQGFRRILDCTGDECGGFDFRFGAELMPLPDMAMDVRNFAQLTVGREHPAAYASVLVSQVRDSIYVQVVTVVPENADAELVAPPLDPAEEVAAPEPAPEPATAPEPPAGVTPPDAPAGTGDAAAGESPETPGPQEPAAPRTRGGGGSPAAGEATEEATGNVIENVAEDERPLLDRLLEHGHVPVSGLAFASGGAELTESSGPALDAMAAMLKANPDLSIAIVGHSDNKGSLNVNIELSRRRADAVRTALIDRGVKAERLEARGVGYLAPRRSNATEEGRALNRRVELVLR